MSIAPANITARFANANVPAIPSVCTNRGGYPDGMKEDPGGRRYMTPEQAAMLIRNFVREGAGVGVGVTADDECLPDETTTLVAKCKAEAPGDGFVTFDMPAMRIAVKAIDDAELTAAWVLEEYAIAVAAAARSARAALNNPAPRS